MRTFKLTSATPRAYLFTARGPRCFSTSMLQCEALKSKSEPSSFDFFRGAPSPPRLPEEEQKVFETLQKQSTGAFSTPRATPEINQSPDSSRADKTQGKSTIVLRRSNLEDGESKFKEEFRKVIEARGKGEELHPNVRKGAEPEFEGDQNPKTGEVGGPKNEPLRWGSGGEWGYNGRTTDF